MKKNALLWVVLIVGGGWVGWRASQIIHASRVERARRVEAISRLDVYLDRRRQERVEAAAILQGRHGMEVRPDDLICSDEVWAMQTQITLQYASEISPHAWDEINHRLNQLEKRGRKPAVGALQR